MRAREDDILILADYFGKRMASELGWEEWPGFADVAAHALETHLWPGNVRELRNVVERAVYRWDDWDQPIAHVVFDPFESPWKPAQPAHRNDGPTPAAGIPSQSQSFPSRVTGDVHEAVTDLRSAVDSHERAILEHHLGKHRYNQRQTAKALGLTYDQLRHAMKKHGLSERQGS